MFTDYWPKPQKAGKKTTSNLPRLTSEYKMAETPRSGLKRKQHKQVLSPAGATPLISEDGNDSILLSDSPPESQDIKRRQKKAEDNLKNASTGNDPETGHARIDNMAAATTKTNPIESGATATATDGQETSLPLSNMETEGGINANVQVPQMKSVVDDITKNTVVELLGKEPSKPRRGRPRRRGLSVDPSTKTGSDDMMTVLLGIRQDNAVLKSDIVKTLDSKMTEFKVKLEKDLCVVDEKLAGQNVKLDVMHEHVRKGQLERGELDCKLQGIEEELDSVRKATQNDVNVVTEQISNVETSLASDIEAVKGSIEEKFEETKRHQILAEDRIHQLSTVVEKENEKFKIELEDLRVTIERLQNTTTSSNASVRFSNTSDMSRPTSQNSYTDQCSNWSSSACSFRSFSSSSVSDQYDRSAVNEGPSSSINMDRSVIISCVREFKGENLKLMVLDIVNEIGLNLKPEEIENVYRIGDENAKRTSPRPVKCVLYDVVRRDQILYFKRRLRQSMSFSEVMINREEHKDLRIKSAMLRHAALMARRDGRYVYQRPDMVIVDNVTYTLDTVEDLPQKYKRNPNLTTDLNDFDKSRDRAAHVTYVGPSLQKLNYGLGFFSSNCFLSNFFACTVVCRNVPYKSVEQGYQARKAEVCGDEVAYHEIMRVHTPAQAKRAGGRIIESQAWLDMKLDVMEELLLCKFRQNTTLCYQLLNTRPNDLFECTLCAYWGTGCKFGSIAMEEHSWSGLNHLGRLLMHVRSLLAQEMGVDRV